MIFDGAEDFAAYEIFAWNADLIVDQAYISSQYSVSYTGQGDRLFGLSSELDSCLEITLDSTTFTGDLVIYLGKTVSVDYLFFANSGYLDDIETIAAKLRDSDDNEATCDTSSDLRTSQYDSVACNGATGSALILSFFSSAGRDIINDLCLVGIFGSDDPLTPYVFVSPPPTVVVSHDLLQLAVTQVTAPDAAAPLRPSGVFSDIAWTLQNTDGSAYDSDIFESGASGADMQIKSFAVASTATVTYRLALYGLQYYQFSGEITDPTTMTIDSVSVEITFSDACQDISAQIVA